MCGHPDLACGFEFGEPADGVEIGDGVLVAIRTACRDAYLQLGSLRASKVFPP
jgi:hypothetical protein